MPALRKPHRIAVLLPELTIDGADAANASEARLLLWVACIEVCQRHPGLAVYDAEATPLVSQDGHFVPLAAQPGALPTDACYGPARRDELIWLELALSRGGAVRLHALGRDGKHETFDALGRNTGEQIHQALERWLTARGLGAPAKRFEAADGADILAQVRVIAPALGEQARAYVQIEELGWTMTADAGAADRSTAMGDTGASDGDASAAAPLAPAAQRSLARSLAARLTSALKAPALRLLTLALRDDLGDLILATDRDQPQALFDQFRAGAARGRDYALLRRIIASAPGWAPPYGELIGGVGVDPATPDQAPPSQLEAVAGAAIAALCRPEQAGVIETAADRLANAGRIDEGIRLIERALARDGSPELHIALIHLHRDSDRPGAWLAQAQRSALHHGCPLDAALPWYPDQIQVDLMVSDALLEVGRLDEAIALRADRLKGREASWPRHTRILSRWRSEPRFVARSYAREGALRGDPARAIAGFARTAPDRAGDVALLLDALVATGREDEVVLAWAQLGSGALAEPIAQLAAARGLLAAGQWRRGVEELWRFELTQPGRDDQAATARACLLMASAPLDALEAALAERVAIGAHMLARRMARDVADFVPGASRSSIVLRALGKTTPIDFDPAWLAGFPGDTPSRKAIDAVFAEAALPVTGEPRDELFRGRADRLVNRWLEAVFADAAPGDAAALTAAACYAAGQALARYLAATTTAPSPLVGGYRTVAAEALALIWRQRSQLTDRSIRALLGAIEPLLRRVDRWIGNTWLGTVERSCALDERADGDVAGFARDQPTVAARILGPEETAVLSASVARLHRDRPDGWASAVAAQASRLASHTGQAGAVELAAAVAAQLAAREIELDDAVDLLHTACYLTEGISGEPCMHAARVLLAAGRGPAAFAVLCAGLGAGEPPWRIAQLASLVEPWREAKLDLPLAPDQVNAQLFEALAAGDTARGEKLGRFAVAIEPTSSEAHRNLGIALAQQGKLPEALHHLTRAAPDQATQLLAGLLYQTGQLAEAIHVLDYASRGYTRADQWLIYGGIACAAADYRRAVNAYDLAYQLDATAFDASQLHAYATALDEVGNHAACEAIAAHILRIAADDPMWKTTAWSHMAAACAGQGKQHEAIQLAQWAIEHNPRPENAAAFAAVLERVQSNTARPAPAPTERLREPVFQLIEASDLAAAAAFRSDPSWRVRRAALTATRYRSATDNHVAVPQRAQAAAAAVLADTAGLSDSEAMLARGDALAIREQAYFARDPAPQLGERMTRDSFLRQLRTRGITMPPDTAPPALPAKLVDRVVVPDGRIARVSDYVALLRDLASLPPAEALAQFDLDDAAYAEVGRAWGAAIAADPSLASEISAGLAKR